MNRATFDFGGSHVLVTGGTSGIGNAIALAFRDAGAAVTVTGTRESVADYESDLDAMSYHQLVMTDRDGIDSFARSVSNLDVLVNNAGANFPGGRDEWEPDVFEESVALNLSGAFRLTTGVRDALRSSSNAGGASVVNVVSMSAYLAVPIVPGYGSGKAGLLQLTRNLAALWAPDAIRVNAVAPGVIDTPNDRTHEGHSRARRRDADARADGTMGNRRRGRAGGALPLQRASELHHRSRPRGRRRLPHPLMATNHPPPRDRLPRRGPPGRPHRGEPRRGDERMGRGRCRTVDGDRGDAGRGVPRGAGRIEHLHRLRPRRRDADRADRGPWRTRTAHGTKPATPAGSGPITSPTGPTTSTRHWNRSRALGSRPSWSATATGWPASCISPVRRAE